MQASVEEAAATEEKTPKLAGGPQRRAWLTAIALTLLNSIGMTVVFPVLPFVTLRYLHHPGSLALWVGVLESVNALCAFLVAPFLGTLSDRIGRRPVLIISVFGAAVSFTLFGIGGSLWVLVSARALQGLTAGDIPALFAYVADITPAKDRAKRFGLLGALTGVGMMIGPAVGGLLSRIDLAAPVFTTAGIAVLVGMVALLVMPESLHRNQDKIRLDLKDLWPFRVIKQAFARTELRALLIGYTLVCIPFYFYANNLTVLGRDAVGWGPTQIGLLLSVAGVLDIVIQGVLLGLLIPRIGERGVVLSGVIAQAVGCGGLALAAAVFQLPWVIAVAALLFASGQGAMIATLDGLMSNAVGDHEQGWLAGGISSIGSALQMTAPLLAGWIYANLGHATPYGTGLIMIIVAAVLLFRAIGRPKTVIDHRAPTTKH